MSIRTILAIAGLLTVTTLPACADREPTATRAPNGDVGTGDATSISSPTIPPSATAEAVKATATRVPSPPPDTREAVSPTSTPTPVPRRDAAVLEDIPGLKVAFVAEGRIWTWAPGADPVAVVDAENVENVLLSDDGAVLAYTVAVGERSVELWAVNADGSNQRKLLSASDLLEMAGEPKAIAAIPFRLTWVRGTHTLAFNTYPIFEAAKSVEEDDLWLVDVDSGEVSPLLPSGQGGLFAFSPNGEHLALVTSDSFSLMKADGSERRDDLLPVTAVGFGEYAFLPRPVWSRDTRSIALPVPLENPRSQVGAEVAVWLVSVEDSTVVSRAEFRAFPPSVAFSPDLSKLAYWRAVSEDSSIRELHIADIRGEANELYHTGDSLDFVGWSPDSERFAFWHDRSARAFGPMLGQLGQEPRPIAGTFSVRNMQWVDAGHIMLVGEEHQTPLISRYGPWELRIGIAGGNNTFIDKISGPTPVFDFTMTGRQHLP